MAEKAPQKAPDTTLYRIAKDIGFNARVEPIDFTYKRLESRMGFFERWREKRRHRRLVEGINGRLAEAGAAPGGWNEAPGDCVCNLRVARMGMIGEFKGFLKNVVDSEIYRGWSHLPALRDRECYMVPVDFPSAVTVSTGSGEDTVPVVSSVRAKQELVAVNMQVRIDETFPLKKMVDFLDATEKDISMYEKRFSTDDGFWPKFTYLLLKKLVDTSLDRKLPVIFA